MMIINNRPCVRRARFSLHPFASNLLCASRVRVHNLCKNRFTINILSVEINSLALVESQRSFRTKSLKLLSIEAPQAWKRYLGGNGPKKETSLGRKTRLREEDRAVEYRPFVHHNSPFNNILQRSKTATKICIKFPKLFTAFVSQQIINGYKITNNRFSRLFSCEILLEKNIHFLLYHH